MDMEYKLGKMEKFIRDTISMIKKKEKVIKFFVKTNISIIDLQNILKLKVNLFGRMEKDL